MLTPTVWTALILASLLTAPPKAEVQRAVDRLVECASTREARCLEAAKTLVGAGSSGVGPTIDAFPEMPRAGQMLALGSLGQNDSGKATTALGSLAADDELDVGIRTLAIGAMADRFDGKRTRKKVDGRLIKLMRDDDPIIRATAARALGNRSLRDDRKVVKALAKAARDESAMVRVEAVLGLGMSASTSVGPTLVEALQDIEPRVRTAAADALSFVQFAPAVTPLIEALRSEDALLRRVASEALAHQTGEQYGEDYALWREWYAQR